MMSITTTTRGIHQHIRTIMADLACRLHRQAIILDLEGIPVNMFITLKTILIIIMVIIHHLLHHMATLVDTHVAHHLICRLTMTIHLIMPHHHTIMHVDDQPLVPFTHLLEFIILIRTTTIYHRPSPPRLNSPRPEEAAVRRRFHYPRVEPGGTRKMTWRSWKS